MLLQPFFHCFLDTEVPVSSPGNPDVFDIVTGLFQPCDELVGGLDADGTVIRSVNDEISEIFALPDVVSHIVFRGGSGERVRPAGNADCTVEEIGMEEAHPPDAVAAHGKAEDKGFIDIE